MKSNEKCSPERKQAFYDKMEAVGKVNGYTMVISTDFSEPTVELHGEGDVVLIARIGGWGAEDRIQLWGRYPKSVDMKWQARTVKADITIAETSSIKQVVSNICKRLLPIYLLNLSTVKENNTKVQKWIDIRKAFIEKVKEFCSSVREVNHTGGILDSYLVFNGGNIHFNRVETNSVKLELDPVSIGELKSILLIMFPPDLEITGESAT